MRVSIAAHIAKKLATVMISTSRFAMCESSWASTASTSCGSSRRQSPVVTATAACFGLRPVAKALGTSVSTIAIFGLGRSASAQSRSTMSCNSGAWSRSTTFAPAAASASLSEVKYWKKAIAAMITSIPTQPTPVNWNSTTANST